MDTLRKVSAHRERSIRIGLLTNRINPFAHLREVSQAEPSYFVLQRLVYHRGVKLSTETFKINQGPFHKRALIFKG